MNPSDSVEGAELEAQGYAILKEQFARLDALVDLHEVDVEPLSELELDGRVADYDPPADQVVQLIASARDHLSMLRLFIEAPTGGLPMMAGYTLIRAALEASATAVWLMVGGTRNKRVFRSLHHALRNREEAEPLAVSLGLNNAAGFARMQERIRGIHASRPGLRQKSLGVWITRTSIVREADRHVSTTELSGLQAWRGASGIAHSSRVVLLMFSERKLLRREGKRGVYYMTASAAITATMFRTAVDFMARATSLYEEMSKAPVRRSR